MLLIALFATLALASDVVDLTPTNFDKIVDGSKGVLVEFFAPWCGHCKSLAPVYEQVATALGKHKSSVVIAKVDADAHKELGGKYGVSGFPTLKWFPKGSTKPEDYSGGREARDFLSFVEEKVGVKGHIKTAPTAVTVLDSSNFKAKVLNKSAKKNTLVEFYAPWCGHCKSLARIRMIAIYEKVAAAFENEPNCVVANVDATGSADLASTYDVKGYPTIKFFPADGSDPIDYAAGRGEEDFIEYLNEKCGTQRVAGGAFKPEAGLVSGMEVLVKEFLGSDDSALREGVIAKATKTAETQKSKYAKYYGKVFEKLSKDKNFAEKEISRLTKVLDSGAIAVKKRDDFYIRINILKSFTTFDDHEDNNEEL